MSSCPIAQAPRSRTSGSGSSSAFRSTATASDGGPSTDASQCTQRDGPGALDPACPARRIATPGVHTSHSSRVIRVSSTLHPVLRLPPVRPVIRLLRDQREAPGMFQTHRPDVRTPQQPKPPGRNNFRFPFMVALGPHEVPDDPG